MGFDEVLRDMFFALFAFIVLFQVWIGAWGVVRLWRLRVGLPPLRRRRWTRAFVAFPDDQTAAVLEPAAATWRRALAWSDICAGIVGTACALLAIPAAVVLPISSTDSMAVARGAVLAYTGFALSGAGSVIGRCIAIAWITPPAATVSRRRPPRIWQRMTSITVVLWAADFLATLFVVLVLVTRVQTPPTKDFIVPAYCVLMLSFPALLGLSLSAHYWLRREWYRLVRGILFVVPGISTADKDRFRSFAGQFILGRTAAGGFFVGIGQALLTMQVMSSQPYIRGVPDIVYACAFVMMMTGALFMLGSVLPPRDEQTSPVPTESPAI